MIDSEFSLVWELSSLNDRADIYEFLLENATHYAADKVDEEIERHAEMLTSNPEMGVVRDGFEGRCLIITAIPYIIFYDIDVDNSEVKVVRVMHQRKKNKP